MSTDTPDADAAWQEWQTERGYKHTSAPELFLAGYAAGSARLDALHAENRKLGHTVEGYADQSQAWRLNHDDMRDQRDAARAECDALRDAITALADEYERIKPTRPTWESVAANLRAMLSEAGERRE